jgi:hypothetical protein
LWHTTLYTHYSHYGGNGVFENWKYLVQTKFQNPFWKSGNCFHEYSWTYMNPLNIVIILWIPECSFPLKIIKFYIFKVFSVIHEYSWMFTSFENNNLHWICEYSWIFLKTNLNTSITRGDWSIHENSWMFISHESICFSLNYLMNSWMFTSIHEDKKLNSVFIELTKSLRNSISYENSWMFISLENYKILYF